MTLIDEISSYIDGNGLVTPSPYNGPELKGSDNGPMYTAEYLIMLKKLNPDFPFSEEAVEARLESCVSQGLLSRVPSSQFDGQEGPDDYYAVLNACKQFGSTKFPRIFLKSVLKYKGALNNIDPGKWSWKSFLIRQPQLLACMVAASFPSLINPIHWLVRLLALPLFIYTAGAISVACVGLGTNATDERRLSWHVWQCTAPVSLLCTFASKLWLSRLYAAYGPLGMKAVAAIYYEPHGQHPFARYWVTE